MLSLLVAQVVGVVGGCSCCCCWLVGWMFVWLVSYVGEFFVSGSAGAWFVDWWLGGLLVGMLVGDGWLLHSLVC